MAQHGRSVEKALDLRGLLENSRPYFFENLVDFNDVHFQGATLNLQTHAWIFYCLSIASIDGKHHLSEVVFSALVGFSF